MLREFKVILQDIRRYSDDIKKSSNLILQDFPKQIKIEDVIVYCKFPCLESDCKGFALLNSTTPFSSTIKCLKCGRRIDNIHHKGKKNLKS